MTEAKARPHPRRAALLQTTVVICLYFVYRSLSITMRHTWYVTHVRVTVCHASCP